jgi:hydroxyacylglutathione hydrolase
MQKIVIQSFPSGPLATNAYVVACSDTAEAAVIDPASDSFLPIQEYLKSKNLILKKIFLTHSHWDHIADAAKFKQFFKAPLLIHSLDAPNLLKPGSDGLPCWIDIPSAEPDLFLEEGMEIPLGNLTFKVIHTPGHSPGCICLFEPRESVLFSGDTLFRGSYGNLSFPTGQPANMWNSLKKLAALPHETRVYPGHGPSTTIGKESSWLSDVQNIF